MQAANGCEAVLCHDPASVCSFSLIRLCARARGRCHLRRHAILVVLYAKYPYVYTHTVAAMCLRNLPMPDA